MKRSGKFYRKNEAEVMKALGMEPTKGSGSGWVEKEDGQNENAICQLKSTDALSISIKQQDIDTLLHNADVAKKIPVFAIQFLRSGQTYLLARPEDMQDLSEYIKTGKYETTNEFLGINPVDGGKHHFVDNKTVVPSSPEDREQFRMENDLRFRKKTRSAN